MHFQNKLSQKKNLVLAVTSVNWTYKSFLLMKTIRWFSKLLRILRVDILKENLKTNNFLRKDKKTSLCFYCISYVFEFSRGNFD